ncbi:MAG: malto-oligosyltrehalose trehalohydrolase [Vicinamibacteraceae bacterium]
MATRTYPVGAEMVSRSEAHVRVWAPDHPTVTLVIDGRTVALDSEAGGYHGCQVVAKPGSRYGFRFDGDEKVYPDPASRSQPDGPHGLSAIVDLSAYEWQDAAWPGVSLPGQVLYEFHVGTFTAAGTWRAAAEQLPRLRDAGITVMQMMPVAEFAGDFGWGYDGVQWFAPYHCYGTPADLQYFVDTAHTLGLAVTLDVVYNHLGPSGNYLPKFSRWYGSHRYANEWGDALNFDDAHCEGMRELVLSNIAYWVREFHVDGFRIDAAQQIYDVSAEHLLAALTRVARETATPRSVIVVAEHEPQHARLMRPPAADGYGMDGVFNEDFHHSTRVALTGAHEAYTSDYRGTSREWLSAAQHGFLFQGQFYPWQSKTRGAPALDCPPYQFIAFIENHDQVANAAVGKRLVDIASPPAWRAMSALLLLGPWTPLLFQGQEWGAHTPFSYFSDHEPELQALVFQGRQSFLSQFTRLREAYEGASVEAIGRPAFEACRLDHGFDRLSDPVWRMYRDLTTLRRDDASLGQHSARLAGSTLDDQTLVLRFIGRVPHEDRLLIVNLGADLDLACAPDPLIAPPELFEWSVLWSSEDRAYGGVGIAGNYQPMRLVATGRATTVFRPTLVPS